MYRIGIIGAGNIGKTVINTLISSKNMRVCGIIASVTTLANHNFTYNEMVKITTSNIEVVENSDVVILCVKPFVIPEVCNEIKSHLNHHIIISMAAGVTIKQLGTMLYSNHNTDNVIRCMPNILISTQSGTIPYFIESSIITNRDNGHDKKDKNDKNDKNNKDRKRDNNNEKGNGNDGKDNEGKYGKQLDEIFVQIFNTTTTFMVNNESDLDTYTIISGCGPGFIAFFAEMLKDEGIRLGLDPDMTEEVVSNTLSGCGKYIKHHGYEGTQRIVASKGGATERGIQYLKENKYKEIFSQMVNQVKNRISEIEKSIQNTIDSE